MDDPTDTVYDGTEHKWIPQVKDKDGNLLDEDKDYTVSYSTEDFTDAQQLTVTIQGKGNYSDKVTKAYTIAKAPLTISTESGSKVYDGKALTAGGKVSGLVDDETVGFKVTGSQTEAGSSENSYSLEWSGTAKESNYTISSVELGTLTVTESAQEIVVTTVGGEFTYNGSAHHATVTVGNLPDGYTLKAASSSASATDATTEPVKATADTLVIENAEGKDVTSSLNLKYIDGSITVKPATLTVTTPSAEKVYDGKALTAAGSVSGLVNGEELTFTTTGEQTEVGSSENGYTIDWNGTAKPSNYTVEENLGTLTVTKAEEKSDDGKDDGKADDDNKDSDSNGSTGKEQETSGSQGSGSNAGPTTNDDGKGAASYSNAPKTGDNMLLLGLGAAGIAVLGGFLARFAWRKMR